MISTTRAKLFSLIDHKFELIVPERAFPLWYVEEGEFSYARKDLAAFEKDYEEVSIETAEGKQAEGNGDEF